jgi:hypothetical protein
MVRMQEAESHIEMMPWDKDLKKQTERGNKSNLTVSVHCHVENSHQLLKRS